MRTGSVLIVLMVLLLTGGAARLALVEFSQGDVLRARAERQETSQRTIPALRGEILDTRGRVLAGTAHRPSVYADPAEIADPGFAAYSVAPVLGLDPAELAWLLQNPPAGQPRFVWLERGISDDELEALRGLLRARGLTGFGIRYEPARVYPQGCIAPHVLGFVGMDIAETPDGVRYEDLRGLEGLEAMFDERLRGTPGRRCATVDVSRRRVRSQTTRYLPARNGQTLVLTIDAFLQGLVQEKLGAALAEHKGEWGTAVVMDPHSGEVLAMATMPDFDPATPLPGEDGPAVPPEELKERWRNRAVTDAYEPGSIFKPFVAACAIDDGIVRLDDTLKINGPTHSFGGRVIHDTHAYGKLAVHEIISKSSNIGMGLIGARCGMERLNEYVRSFGFGQLTGIRLPGEQAGLLMPLDDWNPGYSPQSIPIGQEIAATPIQVVTAFSAFCNDGLLLRPRIVRGVIGPDGETAADYSEPVVVRRVLSAETVAAFRDAALVEVVQAGTGKKAQLADYQVFGKTGTAQIARLGGGGYVPGAYVASFVGGAPAADPRIAVLVSIYKPRGKSYYGGTVAAPVVREIIAETLAYMQVSPRPVDAAEALALGGRWP